VELCDGRWDVDRDVLDREYGVWACAAAEEEDRGQQCVIDIQAWKRNVTLVIGQVHLQQP